MASLKEALNKLTDVMLEEFDQVRSESQNDLHNNKLDFLKRIEQIELN